MCSPAFPSLPTRPTRCSVSSTASSTTISSTRSVRADLAPRYPQTLVHGRHSTPAEVILRLLLVKHLYHWSYRETEARVADSLVLRWFCRVYFRPVPDATTLLRWAHTIQPDDAACPRDRVVHWPSRRG